ncbi:MAG: DUF3501 family protein [Deltaproteobacteria bacterium]|nr:DUF3501 family protein [Deltaproteobacteria bacterium]
MQPVQRDALIDYVTYSEQRDAVRASVIAAKKLRRFHVGKHLTFLFENPTTVRYQVQEMMRIERIVKESDIQHELDTYNELLGGDGQLGATLLVEIDDEAARTVLLTRWIDAIPTLYLLLPDGTKARATYDERQIGRGRLSSVQYLKFDVGGATPVAIGCDHSDPLLDQEYTLTQAEQEALTTDLAS